MSLEAHLERSNQLDEERNTLLAERNKLIATQCTDNRVVCQHEPPARAQANIVNH
ncbi:hypothetical protein SGGMMB4_02617 [Sodalis glossinidius str. 'morsitans']|uniref:Uncharacterized protein n=1 Tax=Sodalis glossinidius (strain morsitans) TaxID=343509 RepID=A0A193QJI4_SODGM|nr:hypothetical protein SGGMMB4_02617 [Sodalis glossinidius str. 'morsitans']